MMSAIAVGLFVFAVSLGIFIRIGKNPPPPVYRIRDLKAWRKNVETRWNG